MFQIKTFNAIAPEGLKKFSSNYEINKTENADAYLIRSVDFHKKIFPDTLKIIVRCGAGFNNVPIKRATKKGIAVFTTPGSNANAVKELIISLIIASSRNLFKAADYSSHNSGADISKRVEREKTKFKGTEITGKKLAVIGVGHVGSLVANAASALGMKVIGYDPYLSSDAAWRISNTIYRAKNFAEAVKNADYITIHVPKNKKTTGMIDEKELNIMKKGAHLFNYSRGGIVNNKAVLKSLSNKHLKTYMTDFGEDILLNQENVIITPHIGGSTSRAETNGSIQGANTIMDYLETGNVVYSVNLPDLQKPFNSLYRITLIHRNIPNMVGQIASMIAKLGINIESMANGARGRIAYTIIDINNLNRKQDHKLAQLLRGISSVFNVRLLKNKVPFH